MKKLLIILSLFIFTTDSFATGISDGTSAPCDNDTLNKYTGTANVEINWEPNTINLNWYNGDEKLTVANNSQSCVYDGTLTVPTQPTKPGYTFNGWKVIRVPGGYTELEYLESTGTQCIDTGVQLTSDNVIYEWNAKDNSNATSNSTTLFGTEYGATDYSTYDERTFSGLLHGKNIGRSLYIGSSVSRGGIAYDSADNNFHSWVLIINPNHMVSLTKDGSQISTISWTGELNKTTTIALYCNHADHTYESYYGQRASAAFKYFRIIDNGNVVLNMIPARRDSDGVLGMYDTISNTFKTNSGSGTFVAGPVVQ